MNEKSMNSPASLQSIQPLKNTEVSRIKMYSLSIDQVKMGMSLCFVMKYVQPE